MRTMITVVRDGRKFVIDSRTAFIVPRFDRARVYVNKGFTVELNGIADPIESQMVCEIRHDMEAPKAGVYILDKEETKDLESVVLKRLCGWKSMQQFAMDAEYAIEYCGKEAEKYRERMAAAGSPVVVKAPYGNKYNPDHQIGFFMPESASIVRNGPFGVSMHTQHGPIEPYKSDARSDKHAALYTYNDVTWDNYTARKIYKVFEERNYEADYEQDDNG